MMNVSPRSLPGRSLLVALVSLALVAVSLVALPPPPAAAAAPGAGVLTLGGGLGGEVDERTGQLAVTVPLVTVTGEGESAVSVKLSWEQGRAAAGVDRSGWGAGWTIGSSFVDVGGLKRVYPASGGSFRPDSTEYSGLENYKLKDIVFAQKRGVLTARSGVPSLEYGYLITYDDGRIDYFDLNGNLAARVDRYGNRTDLTWRQRPNNVWQPDSIIDSYGLATRFDYSTPNTIVVKSPARSDGVVATTTIVLNATGSRAVATVTDPVGQRTGFGYTSVGKTSLISLIAGPTGSRNQFTYQTITKTNPSLSFVAVQSVQVKDAAGNVISPARTYNLDPSGNQGHNYLGWPDHVGNGTDALFESGANGWTYSTAVTTGATTTLSTYDALHRLLRRSISVTPAPGQLPVPAQSHAFGYSTEVVKPFLLPANYAQPTRTEISHTARTSSSGIVKSSRRSITTTASYDDHGRPLTATDETGATSLTEYDDRYSQIVRQSVTGADGWVKVTENTLTDGGRSVSSSTLSAGAKGTTPTARSTVSYQYDQAGRMSLRTLEWAPGADPDGDGGRGPDKVVTKFDRILDVEKALQSITLTAGYGTDAANTTRAAVDLVTDRVVRSSDAAGRMTSFAFDAINREIRRSAPGQLVTTTTYTPTQTTATGPDGKITRTTTDLIGRPTSVTDNVKAGAFTSDPAARTVSAHSYSADGSTMTSTDQAGRTSTTTFDAFGRPVREGGPTGLTHFTAYDDGAAHTEVASVTGEGATDAHSTKVVRYDNRDRAISSRTSYPKGTSAPGGRPGLFTSDPVSTTAYDGVGDTDSATGNDRTVTTDRSGPGGTVVSSTITPKAPVAFPGQPMSAVTQRSLTGQITARTLSQGDAKSAAVTVVRDAVGRIRTATDPGGRVTTYTYTPDGQPSTKTSPAGTLTEYGYDDDSGLLISVSITVLGQPKQVTTMTRVPAGQPGAGQVQTVTDTTGTMTYGYDADGHRISVGYPDGTSTSADYHDNGQLHTSTDVTGAVTTYSYDADDGTLTNATQVRAGATLASLTYGYDEMSRIATISRGNGVVTTNTFTNTNMLASQTTRAADQTVLEAHSYTYDSHRNPVTRTDTYPAGGSAAAPSGTPTWTTTYAYDAYDRLTDSAVYAGALVDGKPVGQPATATSYTLDLAGNVVSSTTTTRTGGPQPSTTTRTSTNTISDSDHLTGQTVGTTRSSQTFDDDGRVVNSLTGVATTYHPDDSPATTTTADGTKTTYRQWPDGSRRSATTTGADGSTSTVAFHYGADGLLINDTTQDRGTGAGATTASYLLTTNREARTLLTGTSATGAVAGTPAAPTTSGTGVGYYLRDRHTSVTALVDSAQKVTGTYAYTDYGAPARADGGVVAQVGAGGGRTNPYTYLGALAKAPWIEASTGLLTFNHRTYDPGQGRFTSADPVPAHNRYQAFRTNPISYADLDGGISTLDIVLDSVFAVMFFVATILTAGAALPALGAVAAAEAAEVTTEVVVSVVSTVVGTVSNAVGFATSATLAIDDEATVITGKGLLSDSDREGLQLANTIAGAFATGSGIAQGLTDGAITALEATNAVNKSQAALEEEVLAALAAKSTPKAATTFDMVEDTQGAKAADGSPIDSESNPETFKPGKDKMKDFDRSANDTADVSDGIDRPKIELKPPARAKVYLGTLRAAAGETVEAEGPSWMDRLQLSKDPKIQAALKAAAEGADIGKLFEPRETTRSRKSSNEVERAHRKLYDSSSDEEDSDNYTSMNDD